VQRQPSARFHETTAVVLRIAVWTLGLVAVLAFAITFGVARVLGFGRRPRAAL
jgi:hypothetical protein